MNNTLQNWLDSKVSDDNILDKYSKTPYNMPRHLNMYESLEDYNRYYKKNDQDVNSADTFYPNLIDGMKEINPEDLSKDKQLKFLDSVTERYKAGKEVKSFLIPPNSNRYHTNYLFKQLVDFSDDYNYSITDSTGNEVLVPFIDVNFKNAFYKFCQENTYK